MSTYSLGLASARHLYRATEEPGIAAQLCVFILGTPYLYLSVLSMCLGMGVRYTYSSQPTHSHQTGNESEREQLTGSWQTTRNQVSHQYQVKKTSHACCVTFCFGVSLWWFDTTGRLAFLFHAWFQGCRDAGGHVLQTLFSVFSRGVRGHVLQVLQGRGS